MLNQRILTRVLVAACCIWVLFAVVSINHVRHDNVAVSEKMKNLINKVAAVRTRHLELSNLMNDIYVRVKQTAGDDEILKSLKASVNYGVWSKEPSSSYENLRRRVYGNIQDLWYFVHSQLDGLKKAQIPFASTVVDVVDNLVMERKRSLLTDFNSLTENDGYSEWRYREHITLSNLMQRRLQFLQNPKDCKTARKLVCDLNKGCGFGCQLHHVVYCLIVAYGTERTMILKSKGWRYSSSGWESMFLPPSNTCVSSEGETKALWPGSPFTQVVDLPIIDSVSPRPPYLPLSIPEDLAATLLKIHGDPIVWWIGQFVKFLLRYQPDTEKMLKERAQQIDFKNPVVGVHIRRTDKIGTEAAFHSLEEYMQHVEDYYRTLEIHQSDVERRVYIATDDPTVLSEAKLKYPEYRVIGNESISKSAAGGSRYSKESLNGIIADIHFLSLCDHLVCTFSSQVCRLAYEMMNTMHLDAANGFTSLDDIYYYGGQEARYQVAILQHTPQTIDELELDVGDIISVAGNHWNGYSKGKNMRTYKIGLYPTFKVMPKAETVKFPTYPEVPLIVTE